MSFEDFQDLAKRIVTVIKQSEHEGLDNVQQSVIINKVIQAKILDGTWSGNLEDTANYTTQIKSAISYMINKEGILIITQDAKIKAERMLCLNVNADLAAMNIDG